MSTLCLLIITIYGVIVHSVYTEFDFNDTSSTCMVQECTDCCYDGCSDYTPITSILAQQYLSNTNGECMDTVSCDTSEWIWPSSYYSTASYPSWGCVCPLCSCSVLGDIQYIKQVESSSVYCYACECNDLSSMRYGDGSVTLRGYECSAVTSEWFVSDPSTISCPPPICTFNEVIYYEGDSWWDDTSFCVCKSDASALCSQTYDDIVSNPLLYEPFISSCSGDLRGSCATDTSLWFAPGDYDGECPRCECDSEGDISYFTELDDYSNTDCYECDCISFSNANTTGYDCGWSAIYSLSDTELESQSWLCPPVECEYNGTTYWQDDYWWDDISNDANCETFCLCQSDGTALCSTTYADIVANDALLSAFESNCGYYITDSCMTDATRWLYDTTNAYSCSCPRCECPSDLADPTSDTWFESWTDEEELENGDDLGGILFGTSSDPYHCDICQCVDGETDCESAVAAEYDLSADCNDASITQCYEGDIHIASDNFTNSFATEIDTGYCALNVGYCGITRGASSDLFSSDDEDAYGCSPPFVCDVLGLADGECVTASYSSNMYYWNYAADGVSCELIKIAAFDHTEYISCCSGDDCNNYELDSTACQTNSVYSEYAQKVYECSMGSQAFWRTYGAILWAFIGAFSGEVCHIDEESIGFIQEPCDGVRDFINLIYLCPCGAFSTLYNSPDASTATQTAIVDHMNSVALGQIEAMNVEHGCGLQYSCDVTTGDASITDEDYNLAFDYVGVNCLDDDLYSCSNADQYVDDVYDANNVSAALDAITITNCVYNSAASTLSMSVFTTFGGSIIRDAVVDAINNDVVIFSDDVLCSVTISNIVSTEASDSDQFTGNNNEPMSTSVPYIPPDTTTDDTTTTITDTTNTTTEIVNGDDDDDDDDNAADDDDDDYLGNSASSLKRVSYFTFFCFVSVLLFCVM